MVETLTDCLRNGIISAMRKRIAAKNSPESHKPSLQSAILLNGLQTIFRAGGNVRTSGCFQRRQVLPVKPNPRKHKFLNHDLCCLLHSSAVFQIQISVLCDKYRHASKGKGALFRSLYSWHRLPICAQRLQYPNRYRIHLHAVCSFHEQVS